MPDNLINGFVDLSAEAKEQKKQKNEELVEGFAYMSYDYVPVNMGLKENKKYHGQQGYETGEAMWFSGLIDNLLSEHNKGELSISKTDMASLTLHRDRMHTEALLNMEKFSGDSSQMFAVKKEVGKLERMLKESISLDEATLNDIEQQYEAAIGACRDYVENKNPWFAAGIERKAMVEAALARVSNEKKIFVEARNAYANETLLDQSAVTRPWDLLVYQLRDKEARKRERKAYEDRLKEEEEANGQFLDNLCGQDEERYHAFAQKAREDNPYLKEEDIRFIFYCSFLNKFETGVKDENGAEDPSPLFKDFGLGAKLNRKYADEKLAADGDFTRMVNPAFKIVKRNAAGQPLNEKEQEKENWNNSFIECIENYYEAKKKVMEADQALKEAPAEDKAAREAAKKAKETAETALAAKREALWLKYEEHFKTFLKNIYIPTAEEYKENPAFYADLLKKDISLYYQLRQIGGMWNQITDFGLDAYKARFKADNPDLMIKMHILSEVKSHESQTVFEPHMMTSTFTVDTHSSYKRYRDVIDAPEATAEKKAEAQQDYDDYLEDRKEQLEGMDQAYAGRMKIYEKMKNASKNEIKLLNYKMEMQVADEAKAEVEDLKQRGMEIEPSVIEDCILLRYATDHMKYQPGYAQLSQRMMAKQKDTTAMTREVAVLMKPVLRDGNGKPIDAEEQKKQDWNQRWLEIFDDETKKEEKRKMVEKQLADIFSDLKFPSPQEIEEKGVGYFLAKDPIYYAGLVKQNLGIDNMLHNEEFKPIVEKVFKKHPEWNKASDIIAAFSQLYDDYLLSKDILMSKKEKDERIAYFQPVNKEKYDENRRPGVRESREQIDKGFLKEFLTPKYNEYVDMKWKKSVRVDEMNDVLRDWESKQHIKVPWGDFDKEQKPARHQVLVDKLKEQGEKDMGGIVSDISKINDPADLMSAIIGGNYIKQDEKVMKAVEAGYYYVKRDRNGKPIGGDEERKAQHNKKWLDAWRQYATVYKRKKGHSAMINEERRQRASKTIIKLYTDYVRDLSQNTQPDLNKLDTEKKKKRFLYSDPALRMNLEHFSDKYLDELEAYMPGVKEAVKKDVKGFDEKNRIWTNMGEPWVDGLDDWGKKGRK